MERSVAKAVGYCARLLADGRTSSQRVFKNVASDGQAGARSQAKSAATQHGQAQ